MPSDTNSELLGLLMQATGNNNNTWGDNLNNFVFSYLEQAIAGYSSIAVTGGAETLSAAEHRCGMIEFAGTLTSNCTVTVDNTSKRWRIFNNTDGAFVLLMKTASGDAIEIPQGTHKDVICDGADNLYRMDKSEVGSFLHFGGTSAPAGYLECSGGTFVRADHPDLFAAIGTTWGAGNGATTAGLPDFVTNNRFLRAAGGSLSVGTYQSNQNAAHTHSITGAPAVSSLTTDSQGAHTHTATSTDAGHGHTYVGNPQSGSGTPSGNTTTLNFPTSNTSTGFANITTTIASNGAHTHTVTGTLTAGTLATASQGGTEARPENGAVLVCIKL
jgi:microcystin-dependent protein